MKLNDTDLSKLNRLFNQILTETYALPRENLDATTFVPMQTGINPWVKSWTYKTISELGMAKIVSDGAKDLPPVSRAMKLATNLLHTVGASYSYTDQELEGWLFAGQDISRDEADTARRKIDELVDTLIYLGDATSGFTGLVNNTNVPIVTLAATGTGGSIAWNKKTLAQITIDIQAMINTIRTNTKGANGKPTSIADSILIPHDAFVHISSTPKNDTSDKQIIDHLKTVFAAQGIVNWNECPALDAAGVGGTSRVMLYKRDVSCLSYVLPIPFRQKTPQEVGLAYIVNCFGRCGGTVFKRPTTAVYGDGV